MVKSAGAQHRLRGRIMRICMVLTLTAVVALALCACSSNDGKNDVTATGDGITDISGDTLATGDVVANDKTPGSDAANEVQAVADLGPEDIANLDLEADLAKLEDSQVEVGEEIEDPDDVIEPDGCTLAGDDCPEGEKCVPNASETKLECVPAGDKEPGELCSVDGPDDCVEGAVCIPWSETASFCVAVCSEAGVDVPCKHPQAVCTPWVENLGFGICVGDGCTPPDDGCVDGFRCSVLMGLALGCVPAGPVPVGGNCDVEDCIAGTKCMSTMDGYVCTQLCSMSVPCEGDGQNCVYAFDALDWGYCEAGCNPITQTGCDDGEACYYEDPEEGSWLCWEAGTKAVGEDCSDFMEFCVPGSDCILDAGSNPFTYHCRVFCDDTHPCESGTCQETDYLKGTKICL